MARPSKLSRISSADLRGELARRERMAGQMIAARNRMAAELAMIDAELSGLGMSAGATGGGTGKKRGRPFGSKNKKKKKGGKPGRPKGSGGARARNEHPLHEVLHQVLKGKTMGIAEMMEAVKKAGFKSTSANFKTMVAIALGKYKNLFKRVDRGMYTAK